MAEKKDIVTDERMEKYLDITARALAKIVVAAPEKSYNRRLADSFLEMANCYYSDAKHFKECGDYVTAFAAVNYAHAWLDCGARIGLFDVDGDDVLFTLYERSQTRTVDYDLLRAGGAGERTGMPSPEKRPHDLLRSIGVDAIPKHAHPGVEAFGIQPRYDPSDCGALQPRIGGETIGHDEEIVIGRFREETLHGSRRCLAYVVQPA